MASRLQSSEPSPAKVVAEHLIERYGKAKFQRLIEMFKMNESGPKIAHTFKVSRQRVHQWKVRLGHERIIYVVDPAIENLVEVPVAATRTTV